MHPPLIGSDLHDITALLSTLTGQDPPAFRARQVYDAVYRQRVQSASLITTLPKPLRERMESEGLLGLPKPAHVYESSDGTKRYLLELNDAKTVETVLMPEGQRYTFCISSQVGCPVNCQFCLTALLGLERNLTAGEIVGQILYVAAANGLSADVSKLNVVMMGQGEPLLNLPNVVKAVRLLADPDGVGLSERRLTLSTSGITPRIYDLAAEPVRPKLAISLNASSEEQRQQLMPITRKYHLKDLIEACRAWPLRSWEHLTFEYVLLKDVNDTDADARRVVKLLANLHCKVNLIALNPGPGIQFSTPDPARVASFQAIVKRSLPCFIRKPRGLDIYAACGQLKRMSTLTEIAI
ncbi:MAG: 23S rRNA (adenine(2503)-C(2))-methyltransferase RlmN [Acidobacteria bacterium]|nr:23S rRNA (adenine(2503)-C(2))-methyltransferase RlmN [Acidobacteriota bacterium]